MKLKNKKTGEMIEFDAILPVKDVRGGGVAHLEYGSLAELNEEWEDAPEEPTSYWFVRDDGNTDYNPINSSIVKRHKEIGNYFESEEEAEKAVEKLKAWKRLKDKGFEFCCDIKYESLCGNGFNIPLNAIMPPEAFTDTEISRDLDLLFGGEK